MSTQYRDGTFGETLPVAEAMKEFENAMEAGTAKSFFFGSEQEVNQQKEEAKKSIDFKSLQDRVAKLEDENNSIIDIPSAKEIKDFGS